MLSEGGFRTGFDYSRWDLNGDGRAKFGGRAKFNLDLGEPTALSTQITQQIEGVSVKFNEQLLTDLEILCYYAYSELYDTDEEADENGCARYEMLADFCTCNTASELPDPPAGCPVAKSAALFSTKAALLPDGICEVQEILRRTLHRRRWNSLWGG